jgi:hypothetical protein
MGAGWATSIRGASLAPRAPGTLAEWRGQGQPLLEAGMPNGDGPFRQTSYKFTITTLVKLMCLDHCMHAHARTGSCPYTVKS